MNKDPSSPRKRLKNIRISQKYSDDSQDGRYRYRQPFNTLHFLGVLAFILTLFIVVDHIGRRLPPGLKISEETQHPNRFIAERAYSFLDKLTKIGPRLVGSYANEVAAVELLKDEIQTIIHNAHPNHVIEMDVQKVSGDFNIDFLDGMTNVYRDVQNVVVKIGSKINSSHSLLLNAHFDTAMDSPGASDDGAGCAVLIEILRVLSQSPKILRHNIIFLFNGAEESYLQGSHGFITQHKWAKEVAAFINTDACGADGREHLLQVGPHQPWLLDTYAEEVPYPFAWIGSQELFERKVVIGETDFRIFRDFGNVSGLEFLWFLNGYVYHTRFDTIERVSLGSLQRSGDNILALVKAIVRGHRLGVVENHEGGGMIYFDVFGSFVLRWSTTAAVVINLWGVMFSLYTINRNIEDAKKANDLPRGQYNQKLIGCTLATLGSWILSIFTVALIAFCLTSLDKTMSWYSRPAWIIFLYIIPTLLIYMTGLRLHSKYFLQDLVLFPSVQFQFYYDSCQLIWTVFLLIGMILRIRSIYIVLVWVVFASAGNFFKTIIFGKQRDTKWLLFYVGTISFPLTHWIYFILTTLLYVFIPNAGRFGAATPAEVVIAAIVSILLIPFVSFIVPLILLIRSVKKIFTLLVGLFILSVFVLFVTPLGFPYSGETTSLAPQRFMLVHTKRTFHDVSGSIAKEQTGYWIVNSDINSPRSVEEHVPEVAVAEPTQEDCKTHLYCGLPYILPVLSIYWKNHWLPGPAPELPTPTSMNVTKKEYLRDRVRITLEISGAHQMAIMVSPAEGAELNAWSLHSGVPKAGPKWKGQNTYFIYYGRGSASAPPFKISMEFKVLPTHTGPIMDFAVCSLFLFEPGSKEFRDFVAKFPSWTAVFHWTGTYESWII